jgi:hypothetical protein
MRDVEDMDRFQMQREMEREWREAQEATETATQRVLQWSTPKEPRFAFHIDPVQRHPAHMTRSESRGVREWFDRDGGWGYDRCGRLQLHTGPSSGLESIASLSVFPPPELLDDDDPLKRCTPGALRCTCIIRLALNLVIYCT